MISNTSLAYVSTCVCVGVKEFVIKREKERGGVKDRRGESERKSHGDEAVGV